MLSELTERTPVCLRCGLDRLGMTLLRLLAKEIRLSHELSSLPEPESLT